MRRQQIVITIATIIIGVAYGQENASQEDNNWQGPWFPKNPHDVSKQIQIFDDTKNTTQAKLTDDVDTFQMSEKTIINDENDNWTGLWFPGAPGKTESIKSDEAIASKEHIYDNELSQKEDSNNNCDNGVTNLELDYDPSNITHHSSHLCIDERKLYAPSYNVNPRLLDYTIPPEYVVLPKCMDEAIEYGDVIPTFGTHRKLWPVYGEYVYVPPQRWIHSLEHGAIVLLYHPCANLIQLDIVKTLIKKCLYRHIITAYNLLEPERPFALVAWGRSMEFSVVDQLAVVGFIRLYALQGPKKIFSDGQYNQTLIEKSTIVTSADDNVLCQYL